MLPPMRARPTAFLFDPEAGRSYSHAGGDEVVSDNERALPAVEAAVRAAIEKSRRKGSA